MGNFFHVAHIPVDNATLDALVFYSSFSNDDTDGYSDWDEGSSSEEGEDDL